MFGIILHVLSYSCFTINTVTVQPHCDTHIVSVEHDQKLGIHTLYVRPTASEIFIIMDVCMEHY